MKLILILLIAAILISCGSNKKDFKEKIQNLIQENENQLSDKKENIPKPIPSNPAISHSINKNIINTEATKLIDITVSSYLKGTRYYYGPKNLVDGRYNTTWTEGTDHAGIGETIIFQFDKEISLHSFNIINGYPTYFYENNRPKEIRLDFSDGNHETHILKDTQQLQLVTLFSTHQTTYLKITIQSIYYGTTYNDTCISEIQFPKQVIADHLKH